MSDTYTDPCYGIKETHIFPKILECKATLVNSEPQNSYRMPYKAKILRFGIITGATDMDASTGLAFALRYRGRAAGTSTVLATYGASAAGMFSSHTAYGDAPDTATSAKKNRVVVPYVSVAGGASVANFKFFMDFQRVYDGGN